MQGDMVQILAARKASGNLLRVGLIGAGKLGTMFASQLARITALMADGRWRTLAQISQVVEGSEPAVSARLRDLRKARFGAYQVERRYIADGLWEYRVLSRRGFDSIPRVEIPVPKGSLF